jgi:hypothetical protein
MLTVPMKRVKDQMVDQYSTLTVRDLPPQALALLTLETGLAYVGTTGALSSATVATNVTFTLDADDTTTAWTITPNSTDVSFNATESLYIVPTTGAFEQVGFASSNDTLPTDAVTTGFSFFGTSVA